jgi:hypothetical protein
LETALAATRYLAMKPSFLLNPLNFFLIFLVSWMNREQSKTIYYLQAENKVLGELLGRRRLH